MAKLSSAAEFINKSLQIHNSKYIYDNVKYVNSRTKICITCPTHGDFYQSPHLHTAGKGCIKCSIANRPTRAKTCEQFVEEAAELHNNLYDYSSVVYTKAQVRVSIICHKHGVFLQTPNNHIHGSGCPSCAGQAKYSVQEFINRADKVHNNKFEYSKVHYTNLNNNVIIICPEHGEFLQHAGSHLRGSGCIKCANSSISKKERKWLDTLGIPENYRNNTICIGERKIKPDAYDPSSNTIYEFWGDFWHGNPLTTNPNNINLRNKKTFGELFKITEQKRNLILNAGYNLIEIWENDFDKIIK